VGIAAVAKPSLETARRIAEKELILVTTGNGAYYVVERESSPPSRQPTSYMVLLTAVNAAWVGRINDESR
jgi:hypothetical protein